MILSALSALAPRIRGLSFVLAAAATAIAARPAEAGVITLDFETAATGLTIVTVPLVTGAGAITASASGGNVGVTDTSASTGLLGNSLFHVGDADEFAQLAFDFDVTSISFLYAGLVTGVFTAQALDASLSVVDSFFDADTATDLPGGLVTLSGTGIRYFRFGDFPAGQSVAVVDDIAITHTDSTAVPEPTLLLLLSTGLAAAVGQRRGMTS